MGATAERERARRSLLRQARNAFVLIGSLAIASCTGSAPPLYDLTAPPPSPAPVGKARLHLRDPEVADNLDTDRILVRAGPNSYAVLAGAKWSDRLPVLLRAKLAATLTGDAGFMLADDAAPADFNVEMTVRDFELDAEHKQAAIELTVRLVSANTGRVAATRGFSAHEPLDSTAPPAVIAALDRAYAGLLLEIASFAASQPIRSEGARGARGSLPSARENH
jgi:cholesterol transport system auxiliary component